MSFIGDNLLEIRKKLPSHVTLVAVSKYHSTDEIMEAYNVGHRVFGENIVQELRVKKDILPQDIEWHFIGHLQQNKIKYIAPYVSMIHSVDSIELLAQIDKVAKKCNRVIPCLLQIHVAKEESKFGFHPEECIQMLENSNRKNLHNIRISGIMGIATNTDDTELIRTEFHSLRTLFTNIKDKFFHDDSSFCHCSWGMSDDYPTALEEGSNMIRVGSKIFGARSYKH